MKIISQNILFVTKNQSILQKTLKIVLLFFSPLGKERLQQFGAFPDQHTAFIIRTVGHKAGQTGAACRIPLLPWGLPRRKILG